MIKRDKDRGKKIAEILYNSFNSSGIFNRTEMPEDILPSGIARGSDSHLKFITLVVSIDYQRDAHLLWEAARKTFEDAETRYLFDMNRVMNASMDKLRQDLHKYRLSKKINQDAEIWRTVSTSFATKWDASPEKFLEHYNWDALKILKMLKKEVHEDQGNKKADFPYLRGDKIGPLWLRMLRDNVGLDKLKNLEKVPIPVDIHVARASLATGVVYGEFEGRLEDIFEDIRRVWFESVSGLALEERPMMALDVDEALWHLSKYGCTHRNEKGCKCSDDCVLSEFCVEGTIKIHNRMVELKTEI